MSDNYDVYVNDDTEPNVSVSADSDVSALVDDDSNVVLDVEEDAGALLNAEINDEELVDVPIEETIGEIGADHRRLLHRDAADQHPMSSITGLTDSLTSLQNTIDSGLISVETSVSDVSLLANGKNTVYHSSSAPTGGEYKVGDTWFNSSESYCMYKWDGSNWVREQFGNGAFANASIWNATIQDGAITNAKIADATIENGKIKDATIESAKISSLNGDKITANSLTIGKMASDVTDAITAAGATASNYITTISGRDGICVHESGDTSNYVNLNSNGMGVFANDSLATSISSDGMNIYAYGTNMASFGQTVTLGSWDDYHTEIGAQTFIINDGVDDILNINASGESSSRQVTVTDMGERTAGVRVGASRSTYKKLQYGITYTVTMNGVSRTIYASSASSLPSVSDINSGQQKLEFSFRTLNDGYEYRITQRITGSTTSFKAVTRSYYANVIVPIMRFGGDIEAYGNASFAGTLSTTGKITGGALNAGLFSVTATSVTTSSGTGNLAGSASETKSGYYPLCVAGLNVNTGGGYSRGAYLTSESSGSCTVNFRAYNGGSSGTITATVYVLWLKITA